MRDGTIVTIGEMLEGLPEAPPNAFVYAQAGELHLGSMVLVDREGLYEPDHVPELARSHGLGYLMMTDTYNDVVENTRLQVARPTIEQVLEALRHYVRTDAFKVW